MSKLINLSKLTLGIAALTLSTSLWAGSDTTWDPVDDSMEDTTKVMSGFDDLGMHRVMSGPIYIVTDKDTGTMYEMDGIKCGKVVSEESNMVMGEEELIGDKITDTRTNRSGTITGIKEQGTMDVMRPNGKTVRYQYVTFKIKPAK